MSTEPLKLEELKAKMAIHNIGATMAVFFHVAVENLRGQCRTDVDLHNNIVNALLERAAEIVKHPNYPSNIYDEYAAEKPSQALLLQESRVTRRLSKKEEVTSGPGFGGRA